MRTSSTVEAPSIAFLTRSFSSLLNNRPAFPLVSPSIPGSNVLAIPFAVVVALSSNETARAVEVFSGVRNNAFAVALSCGAGTFKIEIDDKRERSTDLVLDTIKVQRPQFLTIKDDPFLVVLMIDDRTPPERQRFEFPTFAEDGADNREGVHGESGVGKD